MIVRESCRCGATLEIGPSATYGVLREAHEAFRAAHETCRASAPASPNSELVEALSWALDVLRISLRRIDAIDGDTLSREHYAIREAGLARATAALEDARSRSAEASA